MSKTPLPEGRPAAGSAAGGSAEASRPGASPSQPAGEADAARRPLSAAGAGATNAEAAAPVPALTNETADPTGLIREAYRIEGITASECRSIFLDWAIKLAPGIESRDAIRFLLAAHPVAGHPMTGVLEAALAPPERTGRRGGWRSRRK